MQTLRCVGADVYPGVPRGPTPWKRATAGTKEKDLLTGTQPAPCPPRSPGPSDPGAGGSRTLGGTVSRTGPCWLRLTSRPRSRQQTLTARRCWPGSVPQWRLMSEASWPPSASLAHGGPRGGHVKNPSSAGGVPAVCMAEERAFAPLPSGTGTGCLAPQPSCTTRAGSRLRTAGHEIRERPVLAGTGGLLAPPVLTPPPSSAFLSREMTEPLAEATWNWGLGHQRPRNSPSTVESGSPCFPLCHPVTLGSQQENRQ